jgi:uncharacterized protein with HEPN domain
MSKPDNQLRLHHIIRCIDKILSYVDDVDQEAFEQNEMLQDAIIKNLEIIGEAATKISKDLKSDTDHIQWRQIESLRHRLVHDYYQIDLVIVWNTIHNRLPLLRDDIDELLSPT